MSQKFLNAYPDPILTDADMSGDLTGTPTVIQSFDPVGIQLSWTGANPLGTITVQVSSDYNPATQNAGTWTTILEPDQTPLSMSPAGTPDNGFFNLAGLAGMAIRVKYATAATSDGALTSKLCAKG